MGHDILIHVDHKIEAQFYDVLLKYIGANSHKTYPRESDKKNGVRIVMAQANGKVSKRQIKRWARSRLYFFHNTIVMDIDSSVVIYRALLESLASMGAKTENVRRLLSVYFECIQKEYETYSHRLAILDDIYRILEDDALIHTNSNTLYIKLAEADMIL